MEGERRIKAFGSAITMKTSRSMCKAIMKEREGSTHTHVERFVVVLSASATFVLVQFSVKPCLVLPASASAEAYSQGCIGLDSL